MILHQTTVVNILSPLIGGLESLELFGVTAQFIGGLLVIQSTIKIIQDAIVADRIAGNQMIVSELSQMRRRVEELGVIQKSQSLRTAEQPSSCKYCGSKIEIGSMFCATCGKSQA